MDDEILVNNEELLKYKHDENVYVFTNKQELVDILHHLNEPIINNSSSYEDTSYIEQMNNDIKGILFYWTEYDDWSCDHPYTYWANIIFNVAPIK